MKKVKFDLELTQKKLANTKSESAISKELISTLKAEVKLLGKEFGKKKQEMIRLKEALEEKETQKSKLEMETKKNETKYQDYHTQLHEKEKLVRNTQPRLTL